jgi:hypothetical protein
MVAHERILCADEPVQVDTYVQLHDLLSKLLVQTPFPRTVLISPSVLVNTCPYSLYAIFLHISFPALMFPLNKANSLLRQPAYPTTFIHLRSIPWLNFPCCERIKDK